MLSSCWSSHLSLYQSHSIQPGTSYDDRLVSTSFNLIVEPIRLIVHHLTRSIYPSHNNIHHNIIVHPHHVSLSLSLFLARCYRRLCSRSCLSCIVISLTWCEQPSVSICCTVTFNAWKAGLIVFWLLMSLFCTTGCYSRIWIQIQMYQMCPKRSHSFATARTTTVRGIIASICVYLTTPIKMQRDTHANTTTGTCMENSCRISAGSSSETSVVNDGNKIANSAALTNHTVCEPNNWCLCGRHALTKWRSFDMLTL